MQTMKIFFLMAILAFMLLAACACSTSSVTKLFEPEDKMVVIQDSPEALWSLRSGREYVGEGRYELAREQYLNALAASSDPQTRAVISRELETVDLMIKAQR